MKNKDVVEDSLFLKMIIHPNQPPQTQPNSPQAFLTHWQVIKGYGNSTEKWKQFWKSTKKLNK